MITAPEQEPVIEESSELKEVKEEVDVVKVKS